MIWRSLTVLLIAAEVQLSGWNERHLRLTSRSVRPSFMTNFTPRVLMEHLDTFPNRHIAHIFDWAITPEQFSHPSLPVANWDRRKGFSHSILSLNDYWTLETRWSVCECHWWPVVTFDNVGWSGKYQYNFLLPSSRSNWGNSTWIDFIPHSVHSKYFWQRHMVERSAQQKAA